MNKFLKMLYKSPIGTAIKVGVAFGMLWVLQNLDGLHLHPGIVAILAGSLPILINWLNPQDPRGGLTSEEE